VHKEKYVSSLSRIYIERGSTPPPPCTKLTCNIYSECQRLPDMATQLCVGGRGGSLSSRLQLAITCIVEITCNLHCIHRIRQTIWFQNVVQDDTRNMPLMFVCKWNRGSGIIQYSINHFCLRFFSNVLRSVAGLHLCLRPGLRIFLVSSITSWSNL